MSLAAGTSLGRYEIVAPQSALTQAGRVERGRAERRAPDLKNLPHEPEYQALAERKPRESQ